MQVKHSELIGYYIKLICGSDIKQFLILLLHSERPILYIMLAFLSAIGLNNALFTDRAKRSGQKKLEVFLVIKCFQF